ncbi:Uncharacterised protein [Acinetobacter baumannii]|nr:Uncharacterised protein [Acinetobacter baumannii]
MALKLTYRCRSLAVQPHGLTLSQGVMAITTRPCCNYSANRAALRSTPQRVKTFALLRHALQAFARREVLAVLLTQVVQRLHHFLGAEFIHIAERVAGSICAFGVTPSNVYNEVSARLRR